MNIEGFIIIVHFSVSDPTFIINYNSERPIIYVCISLYIRVIETQIQMIIYLSVTKK